MIRGLLPACRKTTLCKSGKWYVSRHEVLESVTRAYGLTYFETLPAFLSPLTISQASNIYNDQEVDVPVIVE